MLKTRTPEKKPTQDFEMCIWRKTQKICWTAQCVKSKSLEFDAKTTLSGPRHLVLKL